MHIPGCLRNKGERKYFTIGDVTFNYDRVAVEEALRVNVELTWRLHWDGRHWRALVLFDHPPARRVTLDAQHGAVGLDFKQAPAAALPSNADCAARHRPQTADSATSDQSLVWCLGRTNVRLASVSGHRSDWLMALCRCLFQQPIAESRQLRQTGTLAAKDDVVGQWRGERDVRE